MRLDHTITLHEIATLLHAEYTGDPNTIISGINEIHMVEEGDLTFVDHPKYYRKVLASRATTIIINQRQEPPEGKALIFSDDPFRDYVSLVRKYRNFEPSRAMISPSAIIGPGTVIQPGAFIGNHVVIGEDCIIHANVSIYDHTVIGDHVVIHSGAVIGADAFYYKKRPDSIDKLESCGRVILHDHVEIGACSTVDKGVSGDTTIGRQTKLDNHVQIGHDTRIGERCIISAHVAIAGVTTIEDEVTIWGQCAIQKDIIVGKGAVVLAKSGVDKSLEPGKVYFGIPAKEARNTWKEMVYIKRLPELFDKLKM